MAYEVSGMIVYAKFHKSIYDQSKTSWNYLKWNYSKNIVNGLAYDQRLTVKFSIWVELD